MWKLKETVQFDVYHCNIGCEPTHKGSRTILVELKADKLDEKGMVFQFGEIEKMVNDKFACRNLNRLPGFAGSLPTAEMIAKVVAEDIAIVLANNGRDWVTVEQITVRDDKGNEVSYEPW